jgi:hypothetical protein
MVALVIIFGGKSWALEWNGGVVRGRLVLVAQIFVFPAPPVEFLKGDLHARLHHYGHGGYYPSAPGLPTPMLWCDG